MLKIETLETVQEKEQDFGTLRLTHICRSMIVDPNSQMSAVQIREILGYLRKDGLFNGWGETTVKEMSAEELKTLMDDTTGGKRADDFRISDVLIFIQKRDDEKARVAAEKAAQASKAASEALAKKIADLQAEKDGAEIQAAP